MKKVIKYSALSILGVVLLLILAVPFIPAESYRDKINARLTELLGAEVMLGDITLTSLPVPGIRVSEVRLASENHTIATIQTMHIAPRLSSLMSSPREVRRIKVSGLQLNAAHADKVLSLIDSHSTSASSDSSDLPPLVIRRVSGEHNIVQLANGQTLGPFSFEVQLSDNYQPRQMHFELEEQVLSIDLSPEGNDVRLNLQASDWQPTIGPPLSINSLKASGKLTDTRLLMENINLAAYGGQASGNLVLDWQETWKLDSRVQFQSIDLKQLLKTFKQDSMGGNLAGKLTIRSASKQPSAIIDHTIVTGEAEVTNGHLYNTDLENAARALSSEWVTGGQTPFDSLSSRIHATTQKIQLSDLKLTSPLINAQGKLNIHRMDRLDGRITVGLNDPTGIVSMPLLVAGTFGEPWVRPTDEALAGATIGTTILGPGVGTAIGVKAGELIGNIGKFFGADDDEPAQKKQQDKD